MWYRDLVAVGINILREYNIENVLGALSLYIILKYK